MVNCLEELVTSRHQWPQCCCQKAPFARLQWAAATHPSSTRSASARLVQFVAVVVQHACLVMVLNTICNMHPVEFAFAIESY